MRHLRFFWRVCCLAFIAISPIFTSPVFAQFNYFDLPYGKNRALLTVGNYDNIIIIEITINDSIPVKLILDSGVEGVIITDMGVVGRFSDRCIRNFRITAPGNIENLDACITSPVKLQVKGLTPALTNIILLSEDYFSLESYIGTRVHGLIGLEKFRNLVVTTNYDRNLITFVRPSNYKIPAKSVVIPISINRGKPHLSARIELDDKSIIDAWLMIDSGANHPLLLENESLGTYKPVKSIDAIIGKGLAGNMKGCFARAGWLMLGNYRLDNVITSFTDSYLPGGTDLRLNRHGTLGSGALSRFRVTFDYSNERMILQKGTKFRQPFNYNMSGISFRTLGSLFNIFEVSDIIPGSPADIAGVRTGDILLAIDNQFILGMDLGDINRKLSAGEGVKIHLKINRDGQNMDFAFRLKKLI